MDRDEGIWDPPGEVYGEKDSMTASKAIMTYYCTELQYSVRERERERERERDLAGESVEKKKESKSLTQILLP